MFSCRYLESDTASFMSFVPALRPKCLVFSAWCLTTASDSAEYCFHIRELQTITPRCSRDSGNVVKSCHKDTCACQANKPSENNGQSLLEAKRSVLELVLGIALGLEVLPEIVARVHVTSSYRRASLMHHTFLGSAASTRFASGLKRLEYWAFVFLSRC